MPDIRELVVLYVVLLFSACFHEVAHAWTAYMCGDDTAKLAGRLTLNPIVHIDPMGTILFPLLALVMGTRFLFGWAKPVPVNPTRFGDYRRDDILVSLAGITANLLLALLAATLYRTLAMFAVSVQPSSVLEIVLRLLYYLMTINVILAVFNLIPIPPLDGSHVLFHFLPERAAWQFRRLEQYGFLLLILFLYTGVFQIILSVPLQIFHFIAGN
jgi:Zn-dependent protease